MTEKLDGLRGLVGPFATIHATATKRCATRYAQVKPLELQCGVFIHALIKGKSKFLHELVRCAYDEHQTHTLFF